MATDASNAAAAVQAAITLRRARATSSCATTSPTPARVASAGAFWNSPDIWCRAHRPGDRIRAHCRPTTRPPARTRTRCAARPTGSTRACATTAPIASLDAWVRMSVTHWPGTGVHLAGIVPADQRPGRSAPIADDARHVLHRRGQGHRLAPGGEQIVNVRVAGGADSAGDGDWSSGTGALAPVPAGRGHAARRAGADRQPRLGRQQPRRRRTSRSSTTDAGPDFAIAIVIGNEENPRRLACSLEINRGDLPRRGPAVRRPGRSRCCAGSASAQSSMQEGAGRDRARVKPKTPRRATLAMRASITVARSRLRRRDLADRLPSRVARSSCSQPLQRVRCP